MWWTYIRVFNKVISRWQKLWSRQRWKKLAPKAQLASAEGASFCGGPGVTPPGNILNLGPLECISSILDQKLELIGFFIRGQHTNTVFKLGYFSKKSRQRVHVK